MRRMSAGRKGSREVTTQANISAHSPCRASSCRREREDSPPACCEAPSWCAITASAGSRISDPSVAHRIAVTWDPRGGQEGEQGEEALQGEGCGGLGLTSVAVVPTLGVYCGHTLTPGFEEECMREVQQDPERRSSTMKVRVEPSLNRRLREVARQERTSYSAVVRRACWNHVEREGGRAPR